MTSINQIKVIAQVRPNPVVKITARVQGPQGLPGTNGIGTDTTKLFNMGVTLNRSANFTATSNNRYSVDTTSGNITATLPATATLGSTLFIQKSDSTANILYLSGTINGTVTSTFPVRTQLQAKLLQWDGVSSWNVIAGDLSLPSLDARYLGAGGTVTSASVVTANGLAGSVATATTTPAITLSTTVTGVLKGNGTAISAAVAGTDYVIPSGSITGNAATVTTNANLTGDVTSVGNATTYNNVVPVTKGGTGLNVLSTGTFLTASATTTVISVKTVPSGQVVGTSDNQTLTTKTISGTNNTLTNTFTLTTTGTSGAATYNGTTLNIPSYTGGGGSAGITRSITTISTNTSAGSTSLVDYVYKVTGTTTVTLPTAVGNTNLYTVKNADSILTTTIATTAAQTIDGTTTITLPPGAAVDLYSDNTNWFIT